MIDLRALVCRMRELVMAVVPRDIALVFELDEPVPPVTADAEQLRQDLLSLVTNACDALEGQRGTVRVRVCAAKLDAETARTAMVAGCAPGEYAALQVSDDGVGMSEDVAGRVFDPFFTTTSAGRGLGLAATLGIVRSHRGTVEVSSRPGVGSTFSVLLPATTTGAAPRT